MTIADNVRSLFPALSTSLHVIWRPSVGIEYALRNGLAIRGH